MPYNTFNYTIKTMNHDPKRASGRTLGLALQSLGRAIENPRIEVEFIDHHHPKSHAQYQLCKERIESIAKQLNLDVSVVVCYNAFGKWRLLVKSNWVSPYSQRTPAEEAYKQIYGQYPITDDEYSGWHSFKIGFEAAQKND
jgi:hypothetical protein